MKKSVKATVLNTVAKVALGTAKRLAELLRGGNVTSRRSLRLSRR